MLRKLFPHQAFFFDLFEKHAAIIFEAATQLGDAISGELKPDLLTRIKSLEHEADSITRQCAEALHKTFITPIDRDQIHQLITSMDDVIDSIDEASDYLLIYKITSCPPELGTLTKLLGQSVNELVQGIKGLRNLKDAEKIQRVCVTVQRLEHDADVILRNFLGGLFNNGEDVLQIIKWKDIFKSLENASDRCVDVADILEGILLENN